MIFAIGLLVTRRSWSGNVKRVLSAAVMGSIVAASFVWSLHDTATDQSWAYFSTFTRVWEQGVGTLLAIGAGWISHLPRTARAPLTWFGLATIGVGASVIDESGAFPAPLVAIPVAGAAIVIPARIGTATPFIADHRPDRPRVSTHSTPNHRLPKPAQAIQPVPTYDQLHTSSLPEGSLAFDTTNSISLLCRYIHSSRHRSIPFRKRTM